MHIKERDISMFLDNSLNSKKRRKMEEHFTVCKKCKDKLDEWQYFYSSLQPLEFDFELDGLEDKIMRKIKSVKMDGLVQSEVFRIPVSTLVYISFIIFTLYLIFEPFINILKKFYRYTMTFMLDEGLQFINTAKWKAVDIIAVLRTLEFTGLLACIILIAGGIYFTTNRKSVRKV